MQKPDSILVYGVQCILAAAVMWGIAALYATEGPQNKGVIFITFLATLAVAAIFIIPMKIALKQAEATTKENNAARNLLMPVFFLLMDLRAAHQGVVKTQATILEEVQRYINTTEGDHPDGCGIWVHALRCEMLPYPYVGDDARQEARVKHAIQEVKKSSKYA
jgi:heme/copper-type cytochrome/quinol oxidase subunit 3